MHDAIALETRGVPATVVAHDTFEKAARTQAKTMGLPDLPIAVMPRPRPDWDDAKKDEVLTDLVEQVKEGLIAPAYVRVRR